MLACSPSFFEHRKEAFLIRPPGQKKGRSTPNLPSTCCYIHIIQASSRTDRHTTCPPNDISAHYGYQMAIARFLDRMGLALRASRLWLRYATPSTLAQSKERKGSNFAAQRSGAIVWKPEGPNTYDLKIRQ